jgi:hypothetical protein
MNKISLVIVLAIGVLILAGVYLLFAIPTPRGDVPGATTTISVDSDIQEYFNSKLQEKVISDIGQPIEGFQPFMFMQVFSGLVPQDFDGVEALLGTYELGEKELVFMLDDSGPIHSAAEAVSPKGMQTLLSNIQKRAETSIATTEEIDGLLLFLDDVPIDEVVYECTLDQREVEACIQIFQPVCAEVNIQCITTPCEPVLETFSNACLACMNSLVDTYTEGACREA